MEHFFYCYKMFKIVLIYHLHNRKYLEGKMFRVFLSINVTA